MELYTERLILRHWNEDDAEDLFEYAKSPDVGPRAGWQVHTSVENSREIIRTVLSEPETYAVCLKSDNRAVGSIGIMTGKYSALDLPEDEGEIGYWIGVPFWGQGLIPEACRELMRYAFEVLKLKKLWCGYFDGNEKSKRVQEKCGFIYNHTKEGVVLKQMNEAKTEHITCITKEEWQKKTHGKNFALNEVTENDTEGQTVLCSLAKMYCYEWSQYTGMDVDEKGDYAFEKYVPGYWKTPERRAFLLSCTDGSEEKYWAGFVLVDKDFIIHKDYDYSLAEFFVLYKYRRHGAGRFMATEIFDRFRGKWELGRNPKNLTACDFWDRVIRDYTHGKFELIRSAPEHRYIDGTLGDVFSFDNGIVSEKNT